MLIILGALTTTVVALDLIVMVGAAGFVHITNGIFAKDGGWELVGVIVAVELALAAFGPGRYSVDHLVARRRARERADLDGGGVRRWPGAGGVGGVHPGRRPAAAMATGGFGAITPSSGVATSAFAVAVAPTGAFAAVAPAAAARPVRPSPLRPRAVRRKRPPPVFPRRRVRRRRSPGVRRCPDRCVHDCSPGVHRCAR